MKKITIILSVLLLSVSMLSAQSGKTKTYVVGFYNLENLFDIYDDPAKNDEESFRTARTSGPRTSTTRNCTTWPP